MTTTALPFHLLAIDLDGTLLRHDGSILEEDLRAVDRLRRAGVHVTLATGRLYSGTRPTAHELGLEGPLACIDGSQLVDVSTDRVLLHLAFEGSSAELLRQIATSEPEVACFLFANDEIGHDARGEPFLPYVRTWSQRLVPHERMEEHPHWMHESGVSEVVCVGTERGIHAVAARLAEELTHSAQVVSFPIRKVSGALWGLVTRVAGPSKGTAVKWLAAHKELELSQVAVIGDWLNDVSMFQVAGVSFAMADAPPELRACATEQLSARPREGGGVAELVKKVGL